MCLCSLIIVLRLNRQKTKKIKLAFFLPKNIVSTYLFKIIVKALKHGVKSVESCKTEHFSQRFQVLSSFFVFFFFNWQLFAGFKLELLMTLNV